MNNIKLTQLITTPTDNRYLFYEVINQGFYEEKKYVIDNSYQGYYQIKNNSGINRTLLIVNSDELTINKLKAIIIPKKSTINFTVNFNPKKIGKVNFKLILKMEGRREVEIQLINRKLNVEENQKIIKIIGFVQTSLPSYMKLGEQEKIIFLFNNRGNQTVEKVEIKIKESI